MVNKQLDPLKDDLERVGRSAVNRTAVGKGVNDLRREVRTAQGVIGRILRIFGKR